MPRVQWLVLLMVSILIALGVYAIAWATPESIGMSAAAADLGVALSYRPAKQVMFAAVGLVACLLLAWMNYYRWRHAAYVVYGVALGVLLALWAYGVISHGARRWISIGPFSIQPSEFMKFGLVIGLARYLKYREHLFRWRGLIGPFLLTVVPMGLVLIQPDLGTALVFLPVFVAMVFVAGARPAHLLLAVALAGISVPVAYHTLLHDYQRQRIDTFLDPESSPLAEGYQILQARRAICAGGAWGLGGTEETTPYFVPERHNDFIFTVIAEEWGFAGASALMLFYGMLLILCLRIAWATREPFGRLVCVGFTTVLAVQIGVNVGMTIGLAPVTGITLPFLSYGGSSILTTCMSLGVVLSVGGRRRHTFAGKDYEDVEAWEIVSQRVQPR